jgi:formylglycine-generating enzyme required for sulfatase activity
MRFSFRLLVVVGIVGAAGLTGGATPQETKPFTAYVETVPGTKVSFEMVPISGGTYLRGSPETEEGRGEDEGPQHKVEVRPFWMGKLEVTWDEYDLFAFSLDLKKGAEAASAPPGVDAVTRPTPPYTDMTFGYGHDRYPAICMTHHAAMEYCRWLSQKTGKTYRLPTEAEWEYACRAGSTSAYSFGDDPSKLGDYAWFTDNSDGKPQPVGGKKPNAWGLHDMHGNVAEYCLDHYRRDVYKEMKESLNFMPVVLPTEKRFPHVVRGGSWDDDAALCRSAARRESTREWLRQDPQRPQSIWWLTEAVFVGFRVVRPVEEIEILKGLRSKVTKNSPYQ